MRHNAELEAMKQFQRVNIKGRSSQIFCIEMHHAEIFFSFGFLNVPIRKNVTVQWKLEVAVGSGSASSSTNVEFEREFHYRCSVDSGSVSSSENETFAQSWWAVVSKINNKEGYVVESEQY